ncbi:MAG: hypothetical protein PHO23_02330 [Candidatus Pacebacteria bacterium]|nr:hypothetical protein [Candidatus Paceibacterota bacterium]
MLSALGETAVENLITGDDSNDSNGGAAAWISNVTGSDPYTITIENPIGDIDQFRYGDGSTYGDGYYWFSSGPIYTGTGSDANGSIFKCLDYDPVTQVFTTCSTEVPFGEDGYGDDRAPAIDDVIVSYPGFAGNAGIYGDTGDFYY